MTSGRWRWNRPSFFTSKLYLLGWRLRQAFSLKWIGKMSIGFDSSSKGIATGLHSQDGRFEVFTHPARSVWVVCEWKSLKSNLLIEWQRPSSISIWYGVWIWGKGVEASGLMRPTLHHHHVIAVWRKPFKWLLWENLSFPDASQLENHDGKSVFSKDWLWISKGDPSKCFKNVFATFEKLIEFYHR